MKLCRQFYWNTIYNICSTFTLLEIKDRRERKKHSIYVCNIEYSPHIDRTKKVICQYIAVRQGRMKIPLRRRRVRAQTRVFFEKLHRFSPSHLFPFLLHATKSSAGWYVYTRAHSATNERARNLIRALSIRCFGLRARTYNIYVYIIYVASTVLRSDKGSRARASDILN